MDEEERIRRFLRHPTTALPPGSIGPGDDAAVLPVPDGEDLVMTTDLVAEGVHFFPSAPPRLVGGFVATVNLSDLAAMGARPFGFLAAYGVPKDDDPDWSDGVAMGLSAALDAVSCPLIGGDTKRSRARSVTGTALGLVPRGMAVPRSGAEVGDVLVLTGAVGGPAAALALHARGALDEGHAMRVVLGRQARLTEGRILREGGATALVDLSDGLARAAVLMAEASQVRLVVDAENVPLDDPVSEVVDPERWAGEDAGRRLVLGTGGEYELLAAVPKGRAETLLERLRAVGIPARVVGSVAKGDHEALLQEAGRSHSLKGLGWAHFS